MTNQRSHEERVRATVDRSLELLPTTPELCDSADKLIRAYLAELEADGWQVAPKKATDEMVTAVGNLVASLTKEELGRIVYEAIRDQMAMPEIDREDIKSAIENGVYRAIWRMIVNNTDAPCADFYDTIKEAAENAFSSCTLGR